MARPARKNYKFVVVDDMAVEGRDRDWDRARAAIDRLKASYVQEWAPAAHDELDRTLTLALSKPSEAGEHLGLAYRLAHDMKGQGATFGFALISDIGGALCGLTYGRETATVAEIQAMLAHVQAARRVIDQRIEDPECDAAQALMDGLQTEVRARLH